MPAGSGRPTRTFDALSRGDRPAPAISSEGEQAAMAIRQVTCFVAVCDLCGTSDNSEGYTPHGPTVQAVIDIVTEKWGDPSLGWTATPEGRLVCDTVDDEAHQAVHEEAGKTISDCAMTVTFAGQ